MDRRLLIPIFTLILGALIVGTLASFSNHPQPSPISLDDKEWRLLIDGFVQHPLNLTLKELAAMPTSIVDAKLYCVDNPRTPVAQGSWTGVKLELLLEETGVAQEAVKVAFYASDGYTTDLTVTTAMRDDIIIAYARNGEPLTETLRLVVPGKWGYKWISELTHIELVNYDFKGTWESRGYTDEADIPSNS
jgi:DMSO/TMAO reductase YedYZ molybdopterin-dependent catalytic subunit